MEMFALSKRELEEKFTRSELVLIGWRSQEMAASLEKQTADVRHSVGSYSGAKYAGEVPEGLPDHFFRKTYDPETGLGPGELDLRQVTGEEAYKYFASMGIKLPIIRR